MPQYILKGTIFHNGKYYRNGDAVEMTAEEAADCKKVHRASVAPIETPEVPAPEGEPEETPEEVTSTQKTKKGTKQ